MLTSAARKLSRSRAACDSVCVSAAPLAGDVLRGSVVVLKTEGSNVRDLVRVNGARSLVENCSSSSTRRVAVRSAAASARGGGDLEIGASGTLACAPQDGLVWTALRSGSSFSPAAADFQNGNRAAHRARPSGRGDALFAILVVEAVRRSAGAV